MIMTFDDLVKNFKLDIRGVIHVGAHVGQEYMNYKRHGIDNMLFFEPVPEIYEKLIKALPKDSSIKTFNIALGNETGEREMYIETVNQGMSSSLLEPGTHLVTYPHIVFPEKKKVSIDKLDNIEFPKLAYNMLNMDVQGFELEVLKGAVKTLPYIDIIYTEINTEDVYKNCAHVEDLDAFLSIFNFKRVETKMACKSWGDALYIKK